MLTDKSPPRFMEARRRDSAGDCHEDGWTSRRLDNLVLCEVVSGMCWMYILRALVAVKYINTGALIFCSDLIPDEGEE